MNKEYKFYNKVASKFCGFKTPNKHTTEFPNLNPERLFKEKLLNHSSKEKTALDIGCADGRFTLSIANNFKKIIAIDLSNGMLAAARKLQKDKNTSNVSFEKVDASKTTYSDNSFDVIYSRRGPTPLEEIYRLTKSNGFFLAIQIGQHDCQEIKNVFGRGQGYGDCGTAVIEKDSSILRNLGFKIIFAKEYGYTEYYLTYDDLNLFLQGVPIFEDFDPKKDKENLTKYVKANTAEKGIKLPRHRVVIVAKKIK